MFGVAAFGGRIRRRAARCPSNRARRDYLRAVALVGLGCGRAGVPGVPIARARAQTPGRDGSSGFPSRGHPPLAGPHRALPAAAGSYAEYLRHPVVCKIEPAGPWRAPAPALR